MLQAAAFGFVDVYPFQDGDARVHRSLIHDVEVHPARYGVPGLVKVQSDIPQLIATFSIISPMTMSMNAVRVISIVVTVRIISAMVVVYLFE